MNKNNEGLFECLSVILIIGCVIFLFSLAIKIDNGNGEILKQETINNKQILQEYDKEVSDVVYTNNKTETKSKTQYVKINIKRSGAGNSISSASEVKATIVKWIKENPNSKITSIFVNPNQGGIGKLYVTYEQTNNKKNYKVSHFTEENLNDIIGLNGEIVSSFTVGGWRGGIDFVVIVTELK